MTDFGRAAVIQARVVNALVLRDLAEESGDGSVPYLKAFLRPTVMIVMFYAVGKAATGFTPQGIPLLVFVVTGYLTWLAFLRAFGGLGIRQSVRLLMIPHLTPLDLIVGRIVVQFVLYTIMFVIFCFMGLIFEQTSLPADPLGVMLAFWSAIGFGMSLGMIAACIRRFTTMLDDLFVAIRIAGHALSGVFALATDTPSAILDYLRWNPLFHAIEWLRQSWWAAYVSPIADPGYIASCLLFLTAIGLAFERSTRRWQAE